MLLLRLRGVIPAHLSGGCLLLPLRLGEVIRPRGDHLLPGLGLAAALAASFWMSLLLRALGGGHPPPMGWDCLLREGLTLRGLKPCIAAALGGVILFYYTQPVIPLYGFLRDPP